MMKSSTLAALAFVTGFAMPATASAQGGNWEAGQLYATRADLEAMVARFDRETDSELYSDAVRAIARDEADLIRTRLRDGDFEVGDVITLTVAGQASLTNAFTVAPGRMLIMPDLPAMSLAGLLRSELRDSVTAFIGRYVRDPQVFIMTSIRIQATGEIGSPGYHSVSADSRLPDVIAELGQPTGGAEIDKMVIKRRGDKIWDGEALQDALVEGRTLDQLSLRAGDVIDIPSNQKRNFGQLIRDLYYLVPLSFAIMRLF